MIMLSKCRDELSKNDVLSESDSVEDPGGTPARAPSNGTLFFHFRMFSLKSADTGHRRLPNEVAPPPTMGNPRSATVTVLFHW